MWSDCRLQHLPVVDSQVGVGEHVECVCAEGVNKDEWVNVQPET